MTVSLVVPCYNPPQGWQHTVSSCWAEFCSRTGERAELVLVTDGFSEGITDDAIAHIQQKVSTLKPVRYEQNRGKGYALRQGVAAATGDIIIYTDIDFPYKMESLLAVFTPLKESLADVAIGVKDDAYYSHVPYMRKLISRFLRFFIRQFLSMPITDTQCGLKGFRKDVAPVFLSTTIDRYLFDLEFVRKCFAGRKLRVTAIPVSLKDNVQFRSMNYRILLSESVNFARLLFRRS